MIKRYGMDNPRNLTQWEHQNRAEVVDAFDGVLVDNLLFATNRGYMAFFEHYVNPNQSNYAAYFAPYKDKNACTRLCDEFTRRAELANEEI